jgi:hypothetical protein
MMTAEAYAPTICIKNVFARQEYSRMEKTQDFPFTGNKILRGKLQIQPCYSFAG